MLFSPIKKKIRRFAHRLFNEHSENPYDYYATIRHVSRGLAAIFDFKEIYAFIGEMIFSTLNLKNIYLLSAVAGSGYEVVYKNLRSDAQGKPLTEPLTEEKIKISRRSDVIRFFRTSDDIIIKDRLLRGRTDLGPDAVRRIRAKIESLNSEVIMPVFVDRRLALLLALGGKLSGRVFTDEDINLLNTISHQTAIALKNARLYRDRLHTEKLASIGMMSATFAHEIRNPLTSLKTFAQLMPEKYNDAEFRDKFSRIVLGEIERIDGLIEDLLNFSTDRASPDASRFDIADLLDESIDYVKHRLEFENKDILVEKKYSACGITLKGDAEKLRHVFINIINNGCQAMDGQGILKVELRSGKNRVDIAVTDTGRGIPVENIDSIFDPFVTTKDMGMGLGLAISKKIVEDHGGRIKVKSALSKGTTFTVSLPAGSNGKP
ncbi:MAG: hypothetical protein GXP46_09230 [Deferribacteres bacterium]|nr:hypothetical protein [Deferribacteres bacterium]